MQKRNKPVDQEHEEFLERKQRERERDEQKQRARNNKRQPLDN